MRIAVLGFTPREEVLIRTLRRQDPKTEILLYLLGKNQVLSEIADRTVPIDLADLQTTVVDSIRLSAPDVVLVGPDKLSIAGVPDALRANGISAIGADREQIKVETSKVWLRRAEPALAQFYPRHLILTEPNERAIREFVERHPAYVVKYDGQYHEIGGGVRLSGLHLQSVDEAVAYANESLTTCGAVVLEEQVRGIDFSVNAISASDGSVYFFSENLCYKLRNNDDTGPNTSGTGSVSVGTGLPYLGSEQVAHAHLVVERVVDSMRALLNRPFVSGLNVDMRCTADGRVYLLEVNARFAGAGTLSTIMSLCGDSLADILKESQQGSFEGTKPTHIPQTSVSVFAYPPFFPSGTETEVASFHTVEIPTAEGMPPGVNLFTGWVEVLTQSEAKRLVRLKNSTTLLFEARGEDLHAAREAVYGSMASLDSAFQYRRDIGLHL